MKGGNILALICVVGGIYFLRTHFSEWILSATSSATPTCLELLGNTTSEEDGITHIIGSVRNSCDRKYGNVTIAFTLEAMRDVPGAKAIAYVRELDPGTTQQFKTAMPVGKNANFRLDRIAAF